MKMTRVLAIDIGNTNTHAALFSGSRIIKRLTIRTDTARTKAGATRFVKNLNDAMASGDPMPSGASNRVALCSVVPDAARRLKSALEKTVFEVSADIKLPMRLRYNTPETLGHDRVALAAAARSRFPHSAVIAIDFGTAITYDVLTAAGDYLGGLILTGINTGRNALHTETAQLPVFDFHRPRRRSLIGRTTDECLTSGLFWGAVAQLEGLVEKLKRELRTEYGEKKIAVYATGGDSRRIATATGCIDRLDADAVLHGIRILEEMNR